MKKLEKSTFRGINYIELKSLPVKQAEALRKSLSHRTLIKIIRDDIIIEDCVLYSAYEEWYYSTYDQNKMHIVVKPGNLVEVNLTVSE